VTTIETRIKQLGLHHNIACLFSHILVCIQ
jgi:hypothetical protein